MANFLKNVGKAVKHGDRAGHKAKRAVRQAKKRQKKGSETRRHAGGGEICGPKALKSGFQAGKQGHKGAKAVKRGGKQLGKAASAAATRNPAGVAKAFVE